MAVVLAYYSIGCSGVLKDMCLMYCPCRTLLQFFYVLVGTPERSEWNGKVKQQCSWRRHRTRLIIVACSLWDEISSVWAKIKKNLRKMNSKCLVFPVIGDLFPRFKFSAIQLDTAFRSTPVLIYKQHARRAAVPIMPGWCKTRVRKVPVKKYLWSGRQRWAGRWGRHVHICVHTNTNYQHRRGVLSRGGRMTTTTTTTTTVSWSTYTRTADTRKQLYAVVEGPWSKTP